MVKEMCPILADHHVHLFERYTVKKVSDFHAHKIIPRQIEFGL
jgi:hypothetical protein